jgi:hypothetical protein
VTEAFKQAARIPTDGAVEINRDGEGRLWIHATDSGEERSICVSDFNAARLVGLLALMLSMPLPSKLAKAIKL